MNALRNISRAIPTRQEAIRVTCDVLVGQWMCRWFSSAGDHFQLISIYRWLFIPHPPSGVSPALS